MGERVKYEFADGISRITMDDGKVNVISPEMIAELNEAFDLAQADRGVVLLGGKTGIFSAGFDLKVLRSGDSARIFSMLRGCADLALKIMTFKKPVVTFSMGHTYPAGLFLMLASDLRLGTKGEFAWGFNEVVIGLTLPQYSLELARQRLTPSYYSRATITGELFGPDEALVAGFMDILCSPEEIEAIALNAATQLKKINHDAHYATKLKVRKQYIDDLKTAIEAELPNPSAQ
ncbi:MAG: crotonase/enoyl-CoA hydratase family protein [Pseudomonadota bacterium]